MDNKIKQQNIIKEHAQKQAKITKHAHHSWYRTSH